MRAAFCLPEVVTLVHRNYTKSTRGLPADMYAAVRHRAYGPWALGVHMKPTTRVHGIPYNGKI